MVIWLKKDESWQNLKHVKKKAVTIRAKYIEELCAARVEAGLELEATGLKNMERRAKQRNNHSRSNGLLIQCRGEDSLL